MYGLLLLKVESIKRQTQLRRFFTSEQSESQRHFYNISPQHYLRSAALLYLYSTQVSSVDCRRS